MEQFDAPEWAIARALEELGVRGQPVCHVVKGFARYIAANETEPVDPLLIEARGVVWKNYPIVTNPASLPSYEVEIALAALKRGMGMRAPLTREMVRDAFADAMEFTSGEVADKYRSHSIDRLHAALTKEQS